MSKTIISSEKKEIIIGFGQPFCIIGERINPTGRKLMSEEIRYKYVKLISNKLGYIKA